MAKQTIELELPAPEPPDIAGHPIISDLRERMARLEERTSGTGVDPTATEALRLAGEGVQVAQETKSRLEALLAQAEHKAETVVEVHPPAALPVPEPDPELPTVDGSEIPTHVPIWHPKRWF